jgi:hypothetical protein
MKLMKIAVFTRTGYHHTSFINRLQEEFRISCVVRESYPENKPAVINNEKDLYIEQFGEMYSAGFSYHPKLESYLKTPFDTVVKKPFTSYLNIKCGEVNSSSFAGFLRELRPDIVAVLGSSVIGKHICSIPSKAIINLHSGLSPYYRGTWSYGWPIVNSEPEYIGATVHHVDAGIDTGDIIYQTRPVLINNDDLNTIFIKIIAEGIELVVNALKEIIDRGDSVSYKQPSGAGRLYLEKDFNADAAHCCLDNLRNGLIEKYNSEKERRDSAVKLYGYVPPSIFR